MFSGIVDVVNRFIAHGSGVTAGDGIARAGASEGAAEPDRAPGGAGAIAVVVLVLLLIGRVADATASSADGGAQAAFVVALFVVPLLYAVPRTRRLLARRRWQALAVQGVLTYVPFAVFGGQWEAGTSGLLAGLVLLTLPGRLSWPLVGGLLAAEVAVLAGLGGLAAPTWSGVLWVVILFVDDGLVFFGLIRLADIVMESQAARRLLAGLAAARERAAAAEDLRATVGEHLSEIAAMTASARQAFPRSPAVARARIAAAGDAARETVDRIRVTTAGRRRLPWQPPDSAPSGLAAGAAVAPRLAWGIVVTEVCAFGLWTLIDVYLSDIQPDAAAVIVTSVVLGVALQMYHSRPRPDGVLPRAWPVTLAVQVLAAYVPFMVRPVHFVGGLAGFATGSALLLLPGRWRWAGYTAVAAGWVALYAVVPQVGLTPRPGTFDVLYIAVVTTGVGLLVFGLSQLAAAARRLAALQEEVARAAALAERLRMARDVHDLLGLGLSAIALKTDLISTLIDRKEDRAAAELAELSRICARARADVRLVATESQPPPFGAEVTAARKTLACAGVTVTEELGDRPLPPAADLVLVPVLREAVTNILRHSAATACTIRATAADGVVRLHVGNDGAGLQPPAGERGGHGLANLTTRVRTAGGQLAVRHADGHFHLDVEIPLALADPVSARIALATAPRMLQPARLGGNAHRVHPVARAELGDRGGEVVADRAVRQVQGGGDFVGPVPRREPPQHLGLAR
jgi:two-component system, NarL family, sensor histidine kinase DesK